MEIVDEESLLGRGLMNELDNFSLSALDNVSLASSRPRTFVKQNSVDSNSSGNNSGTQSLSDYSDMDIECQMALLVTTCLNKIKTYSLDGASRMGTPTLDMEVQIQCKYRELGLPDDGMPGARLQERYNTRCSQSTEALTAIQSTIESFLMSGVENNNSAASNESVISKTTFPNATLPCPFESINVGTLTNIPLAPLTADRKITSCLERSHSATKDVKEVRTTLEGMFKLVSGSFRVFSKQALPQPLVPESFTVKVYNLINNVDFEFEALDNLLDQVDGIVVPLSKATITDAYELRKQIQYWRRQNYRIETKYHLSIKHNLTLSKLPTFNSELFEHNKITEIVKKQLTEYGKGIFLELQTYFDRIQAQNQINGFL